MCDSTGEAHAATPPAPTVSEATVSRPRFVLEPVDAVTITVLVDNVFDVFMPDQGPARRWDLATQRRRTPAGVMVDASVPEQLLAEHGFSVLVTVENAGRSHNLLFDCGCSPDGMVENMRRLDIDARDIEAIVCSHGHFDHTTGLDGLIRELGRPQLPVLIHPDFWRRRRVRIHGREPLELPTTSRAALEGAGFEIAEERQPSFVFERSVLVTGEVDRTTGYEPGIPGQDAWVNGAWEPDALVLDDQALVVHVRDRGLVVVTGCGHAGIVNTARYARALTGVDAIHALVGGFHLNGPIHEPLIDRVCADLGAMRPAALMPGHCTGWRAHHRMARTFGDAYVPSCVGTRLIL
ncbi:MAG TPA: MBL fold metallo-hydrolase [Candidatus Dormibacteraeota bacterium]|nr:MBL fold metallo-hydrolase [Candidatus Dormibacteraeota bacterium]